jgi:hypothetical protein
VTVVVVVVVVVAVTVVMTVTVLVVVVASVTVATRSVAARLGLEGSFDQVSVEAKLVHQPIQHVVVLVREAPGLDLQGNVPIAEVVSGPRQQVPVGGLHRGELLRLRADSNDEGAVPRRQPVSVFEGQAALEQEAHLDSAVQARAQACPATQLEHQREGVRGRPRIRRREHRF